MLKSNFLIPAKKLELFILLAIFFTAFVHAQTTLEEQFRGIESCSITNIYLDPVSRKARGVYFSERKLEPCRVDEVAFYCVNDTFYGLHVSQVAIPYIGPFSVHAIYFEDSLNVIEKALRTQFKDIKLNQGGDLSPVLIADPKRHGSSVFYCDRDSE